MPGGTGLGKPLKSSIHPLREDIPIFLGGRGSRRTSRWPPRSATAGMPLFLSPYSEDLYRASLEEGFARDGVAPQLR